jgi:hypothetical protein
MPAPAPAGSVPKKALRFLREDLEKMTNHPHSLRLIAARLVREGNDARAIANSSGTAGARQHWLDKTHEFDEMAGTLRAIALIVEAPEQGEVA